MKIINIYLLHISLLFLLPGLVTGQESVNTGELQKLDFSGHHPTLSTNGNYILYSSSNYSSLFLYNVNTSKSTTISKEDRSGYGAIIVNDNVIFKPKNSKEVYSYNVNDKSSAVVEGISHIREYKASEKADVMHVYAGNRLEDIVIDNGSTIKTIAPLGQNDYLNISLSPDQSKILFRVSGVGSFVSDLEGNVLYKNTDAQFPSWKNNNEIIYAKIEDDGYEYLSSDLYIASIDGTKQKNLTSSTDVICLYPSIQNNKIIFNSPEQEVYVLEIE